MASTLKLLAGGLGACGSLNVSDVLEFLADYGLLYPSPPPHLTHGPLPTFFHPFLFFCDRRVSGDWSRNSKTSSWLCGLICGAAMFLKRAIYDVF